MGYNEKSTIHYCPICGTSHIEVINQGNFQPQMRLLTKFEVNCAGGDSSDVLWPADEHEDGCECGCNDEECEECGDVHGQGGCTEEIRSK